MPTLSGIMTFLRSGRRRPVENPLLSSIEDLDIARKSGFFDADWYVKVALRENLGPDRALDHYLSSGWKAGHDPGPHFDSSRYLELNPDVKLAGMEPLTHYLKYGIYEGRLMDTGPLDNETQLTKIAYNFQENFWKNVDVDGGLASFLRREAGGRSYLECGYRGLGSLQAVDIAVEAGARTVTLLSRNTPAMVREFLQVIRDHHSKSQNSPSEVRLVEGDIFDNDILNMVGETDIILFQEMISNQFEPLKLLKAFARITKEIVVFQTFITRPFSYTFDDEVISFAEEDIWFTGSLTERTVQAVRLYDAEAGLDIPRLGAELGPSSTWAASKNAEIGIVCWWLWGSKGIDKMVRMAGLEVVDISINDQGRAFVVCRKVTDGR